MSGMSALAIVAVVITLSSCSGAPVAEIQVAEVPRDVTEIAEDPPPAPGASDFVSVSEKEFDVDLGGPLIIDGYLEAGFTISNVSDQTLSAIATTIRVNSYEGRLLFSQNMNDEIDLMPGEAMQFGFTGDNRAPLLRQLPEWEELLDLSNPKDEAELSLAIRKIALSDGTQLIFVEDKPEELKLSVDE